MTYNTREISNAGGQPVSLYEFRLGNTYWRFCNADQDLTFGDDVYTAYAISDDGMTQGGSDQNDLQITIPTVAEVAQLFRSSRPSGKVWLTARHWHYGDDESETPTYWVGSITNSILIDRATATLYGRSIGGTYDRNGLRLPWGRSCPHPLYGIGCFVDKTEHEYSFVVDTVNGTNFTVEIAVGDTWEDPAEGSFSGGFIEWLRTDGSTDRRGIEKQDGNDFRVFGGTDTITPGLEITAYPGCNRATSGCKLFDNLPNYGGFPHLPGKSPFDGTPIF